jgi:hypothetical protein
MSVIKPAQRDFFELVKAIGESKSKQEEDRIIADEVRKILPSGSQQQRLGLLSL